MKIYKVKAGALTYAIFVMLITIIIIGTITTIAFYNRSFIERELARLDLVSFNNSLLTASINDSTISFPYDGSDLKLTDNENYKFEATETEWGGFSIIDAKTSFHNYAYEQKLLCGRYGAYADGTALYFSNKDALAISGTTLLKGICYLPKAGIKATYMEGTQYKNHKLVDGKTLVSNSSLPDFNSSYISNTKKILSGKLSSSDSIIDFSELKSTQIYNPFSNATLYLTSSTPLYLNNCSIKGRIIIICSQAITIFETAELIDIQIYAPNILFKEECKCCLQAYARDTLIVEKGSHLSFPSIIAVVPDTTPAYLLMNESCQLEGNIWVSANSNTKKKDNMSILKSNSNLNGIAYFKGKTSIQGNVNGSIYCEDIVLRSSSSYYINHLFNATVDAAQLSPYYVSANFDPTRRRKIIKKLEP